MAKSPETPRSRAKRSSDLVTLRAENRRLKSLVLESEAATLAAVEAVEAWPTISKHTYAVEQNTSKPLAAVCLTLCDWHTGAAFDADKTLGVKRYNFAVAEERRAELCKRFLSYVESQRFAYQIDTCYLLGNGDLHDGMLRDESMVYNEFEPMVQPIKVAEALTRMAATLTPYFGKIVLINQSTDNHGRITRKVFSQNRGKWSLGHMTNAILAQTLKGMSGVTFIPSDSIKYELDIFGWKFLMEHGNDIQGWLGIPYYGLNRMVMQEAQRRSAIGLKPIDFHVISHFHCRYTSERVFLCPALCGATPYTAGVLNRYSPAAQSAWLVNPKHGVFNHVPFELE